MNLKVNLTKRVKLGGKDTFCPVVMAGNGRVKPDWVLFAGKEERASGGAYYIDWTQDGRRKRISAGKDPAQALARKLRKEAQLKATSHGIDMVSEAELDKRRNLQATIPSYLEEIKLSKKQATFWAYNTSLTYFQESCTKQYVEEIERTDMLKFAAFLRTKKGVSRTEKGMSPRTCRNKFGDVMVFLKAVGVNRIVNKNDWPRYVETEVEVYEKEELDTFFAACTPTERMWFEFFLMTGMREQEVTYCSGRDINYKQGSVTVRWNPAYKWSPKSYKEREIPVPAKLIAALEKVKPQKGSGLLFPTATGKPQLHFYTFLKAIVRRSGMDENDFWLHKFRATFATWHLQAGVDLRTVQDWMGHTDLKSTLRYLRPARGQGVRDKVNATFA